MAVAPRRGVHAARTAETRKPGEHMPASPSPASPGRQPGPAPELPRIEKVLRTPDSRFGGLDDFPYRPHYTEIGGLRVAHVDEGPRDAPVVLLMHGEPTWSYLYRKMIPGLVAAGLRAVAPDLVGFGRSDKPARQADYSYERHVAWMTAWLVANDLNQLTLFCQDWGSLIGLRLAAEQPGRFDRIVLSNGGLPTGTGPVPRAFHLWRAFARYSPIFPIGRIVRSGCARGLDDRAVAAYDAPFPSLCFRAGARAFPSLVPIAPGDPAQSANERAWAVFEQWHKPFLTLFGTRDPITRGGERQWQQRVPGAAGQPHTRVRGAGHFIQEDAADELVAAIVAFVRGTPEAVSSRTPQSP
jgi:haloalkane dehalogenase